MNINMKLDFTYVYSIIAKAKVLGIIILFSVINSCVSMPQVVAKITIVDGQYYTLKKHFKWMNQEIYPILKKECKRQHIDIRLMCSIIQYESGDYCKNDYQWMKKVHSTSNAIGLCQVLVRYHSPNNPHALYNPEINVKKGVAILAECLTKAQKENWQNPAREACRYYNAGPYSKRYRYNNWSYVNKIWNKYNGVL